MIYSDLIWCIHPAAALDLASRMTAYLKKLDASEITGGPASDAERDGLPIQVVKTTAIIPIMGPILRRVGPIGRMFGLAGSDSIRYAMQHALADPDIEQILLRIDSPGGSVSGIAELVDVVAAAEKPVIAQVEGMAASAAYWIASQADSIKVGRMDLVGSIGARLMLYDWSKAFEIAGIEAVPIDTGEFKSAGAPGTEITEAQRADFQRLIDAAFDDFVRDVSAGRNLTDKQVRAVGDGRLFTPEESLQAGLIDGVATLEQTLAEIDSGRAGRRSTQSARARLQI
jgi:signal peptide peptidase SppA